MCRASDSRGLSLDELLQAYQESTGVPLTPSDHGFTRQAFVIFLTGQLPVTFEPLGRGQFVLKWTGPEPTRATPDRAGSSTAASFSPHVATVPRPLAIQGPFTVQEGLSEEEYCPVYVSQVFSIHRFYVQLKGTETSVRLESLMNELEKVSARPSVRPPRPFCLR